jgi:2-polyprenyl-3-methyl-5-hydroxy-6-metoxy-1,4-benzoquinol methylase
MESMTLKCIWNNARSNKITTYRCFEHLQVDIIVDLVESWSGPDELMDVILLVEVLYHIPDPKILFARCRQWLSPGGVMIIGHGGEDIFFKVGTFCCLK